MAGKEKGGREGGKKMEIHSHKAHQKVASQDAKKFQAERE